jgi:hypothetical protein
MYGPGEVFRSFEFALDERLVDDDLCGDVGKFASLPVLPQLSTRACGPRKLMKTISSGIHNKRGSERRD